MADKRLVINTNMSETRVALVDADRVTELYIERQNERGMVGNIYVGTINRVLPGMQAAFVNIGAERTAFLYAGDVLDPEVIEKHKQAAADEDLMPEDLRERDSTQRRPIQKILRDGQEVVVQVAKEPLGTKGARVTMYLSLPGRYLVLMPEFNHIGISRRIENEEERERLQSLIKQIKPENVGIIVRTAAEGVNTGQLQKDLKYLIRLWRSVASKRKRSQAPTLLYHDLNLIHKTVRDVYSEDIDKITIDNREAHQELKHFLTTTIPGAAKKLELYREATPIFDVYGVEMDIGRALSRKIELPSGGHLVIDQTEALTSFDVNTGKFVGQMSAQDTILRTNLESIKSIVSQLRLRNIGGIIVIDFIDMERPEDREKVYDELVERLKDDKARTNVLRVSELGLVQMTRKRTSESLEHQMTVRCPHCEGRGRVRSVESEAFELLRELIRHNIQTGQRRLKVRVRSDIKEHLLEQERELFADVTKRHKIKVDFEDMSLDPAVLMDAPFEVLRDE